MNNTAVAVQFEAHIAQLRERSKNEPASPHPSDITSLEQLACLAGHVVKYTLDRVTWRYTLIVGQKVEEFSDGSFGYRADEEFLPSWPVHGGYALTDNQFERGMVVRPARISEYKDMVFFGGSIPPQVLSEAVVDMLVAATRWPRSLKKAIGKPPSKRTRQEGARVRRVRHRLSIR